MGSRLEGISAEYEGRYGDTVRSSTRLRGLYDLYVRRRESTLLDAVAATAAVDAVFFADEVDMDAATPQMGEAFARAYPGQDIGQRLEELGDLEPGSPEVEGFLSNWKGVYHEVLIRDRLNDGGQIGGVVLGEGQRAVLAEELNQPGLDLRVLNSDGTEDLLLQAKATSDLGLLNEALQKYPGIEIAATDEMAGQIIDERVFPSGFGNEDLQARVEAPTEELWDGPVEELVETVLPGLPFVILLTTEGTRVLMGRQSYQAAMRNTLERGAKTGTAMAVGALAALAGAGVFSLPAAFVTRLGIDRAQIYGRLASKIEADIALLFSIVDESNGNSGKGQQASVGMAIGAGMGMALGAGVGAALENVGLGAAIGVALGVGVGLAVGTVLSTRQRE